MKKNRLCGLVLVLAILAGFSSLAVRAQAADGKGLEWWIYQDVIYDEKEEQYVEARKEIIALLHKDRISAAEFQVLAMRSYGAACVVYAAPVNINHQGRDASNISVDWTGIFSKLGPKYLDAWNRMRDATRVSSEYLLRYRPDLSYTPNNPRFSADEQKFVISDYYYTAPRNKQKLERTIKSLRLLHHEKGLSTGFRVFEVLIGPEKPGFFISAGAGNYEELETTLQHDKDILGREGEVILNKARKLSTKTEVHEDQIRVDLSYFAAAQ